MAHGLHYCGHHDNPAKMISLRAIDPERYSILNEESGEVIEEIEESNAFYEVYDGAVYMFQVGMITSAYAMSTLSDACSLCMAGCKT